MATTLHKISFFLSYPDGVLCDHKHPLRPVIMHDHDPRALVYNMWEMHANQDLDIEGIEFYLDGVLYEANSVLMHYLYAHGRGDYESMMAAMRLSKAA